MVEVSRGHALKALLREYRPTMDKDIVHSWAKDMVEFASTLQAQCERQRVALSRIALAARVAAQIADDIDEREPWDMIEKQAAEGLGLAAPASLDGGQVDA
ncbi:hypothetical protein [Sphingomonas sp. PB4P5]|uniref:hypothetical protein n=1 Tax=Parasphingomonas puruogangriensis TaxID=3096155 RepID=UPI002FC6E5D6